MLPSNKYRLAPFALGLAALVAANAFRAHGSSASLLGAGSHCVAYRVEKVMFFVSSQDVVGKNCDISAQVLPEVGGLYHIEVNIPIRSFSSGDEDRDRDVQRILKGDERSELTFRSKAMSADEWHALFKKKNFELAGELAIGERSFPLKLEATYSETKSNAEVDGVGNVRFADFDIKPPKVGGGVIAKAKPDIELHFHLISTRILSADSIRLGEKKSE